MLSVCCKIYITISYNARQEIRISLFRLVAWCIDAEDLCFQEAWMLSILFLMYKWTKISPNKDLSNMIRILSPLDGHKNITTASVWWMRVNNYWQAKCTSQLMEAFQMTAMIWFTNNLMVFYWNEEVLIDSHHGKEMISRTHW